MTSGICEYKGCKRVIYDERFCICHSPDLNKNTQKFYHELNEIFGYRDREIYNCDGFVFVVDDPFLNSRTEAKLSCVGATFVGRCIYRGKTWKSEVDFRGSKFLNEVDFSECAFHKGCNFSGAIFRETCKRVSFAEVQFHDMANFVQTSFQISVDFSKSSFQQGCRFTDAKFSKTSRFIKTRFQSVCFMEGDMVFKGPASFDLATFTCRANFARIEFQGGVSFDRTIFERNCSFSECIFGDGENQSSTSLSFLNTQFSNDLLIHKSKIECATTFSGARIDGIANVLNSEFRYPVDFRYCRFGKASFDAAGLSDHKMFHDVVDFGNLVESEKTSIQFRHIDMHTARLIEAPIHLFEFVSARWGRREDVHETEQYVQRTIDAFKENRKDSNVSEDFSRLGIHENHDIALAYGEAAQVYRKLQDKYLEYLDPLRSGIFYHKEQHLIRKAYLSTIRENLINRNVRRFLWGIGSLCLHWLYRVISGYGESTVLPLIYLGFLLVGIPWIFLMSGYNLDGQTVNYDFTGLVKDLGTGFGDFLRLIAQNLSEILTRKANQSQSSMVKTVVLFQTILIPIFLTFWILAIRRRYKRKSY